VSTLKWILLVSLFVLPADFSWAQRAYNKETLGRNYGHSWNRGRDSGNSNNYFYSIYDVGPNIEFYSLGDEEDDTDPCFPVLLWKSDV
jgi:hypothetical protein